MSGAVAEAVRLIPVGDHLALIDAEDYPLVAPFRWWPQAGRNGTIYAATYAGGRTQYMHRMIARTPDGYETDHGNGDGLDNRRSNVRPATPSQNRANMGKPRRPDGSPHSSAYKGVSWDRSRNRWQSKIQIAGRHRNLGRYDDEESAARAYDAAALEQWGEFARPNFPRAAA